MFFYKYIKRRETAEEIFKIVDNFKKEKSVKLSDCVGVCIDTAWVMAGNKGLQALIKQKERETVWTHCMIHHESLVMKELCQELSEVMDTVIKTVNYMNTQPLECRFFVELCEEMWAQYQSSFFYSNFVGCQKEMLWLIYNLQVAAALFLEEENLVYAEHFRNEHFVSKFAYLGDIF